MSALQRVSPACVSRSTCSRSAGALRCPQGKSKISHTSTKVAKISALSYLAQPYPFGDILDDLIRHIESAGGQAYTLATKEDLWLLLALQTGCPTWRYG